MKNFLIPTFPSNTIGDVLSFAIELGRRNGARLSGIAADGLFSPAATPIQFVGEADVAYIQARAAENEVESEKLFISHMTAAGAPRLAPDETGFGFDWVGRDERGSLSVPEQARAYDVTIVSRRGKDAAPGQAALLDDCLFESGRPILVVPPERPQTFGDHIVIAWNASSETARTVALGSRLLNGAKKITVVETDSSNSTGPTAAALARNLARNGLPADFHTTPLAGRSAGQAFLDEAQRLGADILFKGAYTQSRLRQMVFGGATAHLLSHVTLPMFMAN
ncbi:MAG: universal stress protein [Rhizobiales bacterium]|nr:universal stress protein [Hyphomicrobiales bacterium]